MYQLSVFIHLVLASIWLGGMIFTVLVLVPISRSKLLEHKKGAFFALMGKKFSRISWIIFAMMVITGITNLLARGVEFEMLFTSVFWQSSFGEILSVKLELFGAVLVISGIHDFYAGPRAARLMDEQPKSSPTNQMRKLSSWLGRLNLLLGLSIVYFAIKLVRG